LKYFIETRNSLNNCNTTQDFINSTQASSATWANKYIRCIYNVQSNLPICLKRSHISCPATDIFICIETLLTGHLSYRVTFSFSQWWPLNTGWLYTEKYKQTCIRYTRLKLICKRQKNKNTREQSWHMGKQSIKTF
jgi:hypothetical protein